MATKKLDERENGVYVEEEQIVIAGKVYPLYKKGLQQAEQVKELLQWLSKYLRGIAGDVSDEEGNIVITTIFDILDLVAQVVSPEALVDLFAVATGCTRPVAEKEFDLSILLEVVEAVYSTQPTYRKIVSRFFSTES